MDRDLVLTIAMIATLTAWWWFGLLPFHGTRNSLWMAFSTTGVSALCLVSGIVGYDLSRHSRFVAHTSWSPTVIWWEIATGVALAPVAAYFWRKGLRSPRPIQR
jgi:hypothetical protein